MSSFNLERKGFVSSVQRERERERERECRSRWQQREGVYDRRDTEAGVSRQWQRQWWRGHWWRGWRWPVWCGRRLKLTVASWSRWGLWLRTADEPATLWRLQAPPSPLSVPGLKDSSTTSTLGMAPVTYDRNPPGTIRYDTSYLFMLELHWFRLLWSRCRRCCCCCCCCCQFVVQNSQ